jgi:Icc-related predicted phosphoesterase
MKIACISDTHGAHKALDGFMPEADVLVHAGDLTSSGKMAQWIEAVSWLEMQLERYEHVVVVAGNHDFVAEAFMKENAEDKMRTKMFNAPNFHYLRDSGCTIGGKYFYGSPWTPRFFDWAFNVDRGLKIKRYWDLIPAYTNVLVTHGPPMGILDRVGYENVGCLDLLDACSRVRPQASIFGHIHCGHGEKLFNGTTYVNAAIVDESYRPDHIPTLIEI